MAAHGVQSVAAPAPDLVPVLQVDGLTTEVRTRRGSFNVVDGVSFSLDRGEILGLVGESGSGKTMTALSLIRLLPAAARITGGRALVGGVDIVSQRPAAMRRLRGKEVSMVFQEPMTSLDPAFTVGQQLVEAIRAHRRVPRSAARARALEMLDLVGIPNPAKRLDGYPHQFSGGMRQRAMLAIALALEPKLLIADEPTTALDVTIQAQILELVARLRDELGMSVLLITHNLAVVHEIADRVAVMYAGEIVENGPVATIFDDPQHPYTQGLLRSMPGLTPRGEYLAVIPGRVPELHQLPSGCRFAPRCPNRIERCALHPDLRRVAPGHELRCTNPTPFAR
ncbi:MAG TPA: ABC transporter ATP-binding protein [Gaiellaceae bacterium]|nr:ABC transporter ATP-binding protein [Gaiellaceae bacterium]